MASRSGGNQPKTPPSRSIKRFKPPAPFKPAPLTPLRTPPNKIAADAVRKARKPGKINPKQQVY